MRGYAHQTPGPALVAAPNNLRTPSPVIARSGSNTAPAVSERAGQSKFSEIVPVGHQDRRGVVAAMAHNASPGHELGASRAAVFDGDALESTVGSQAATAEVSRQYSLLFDEVFHSDSAQRFGAMAESLVAAANICIRA